MSKPKIYVWCNSCAKDWHSINAMAEDGTSLAGHVCSSHAFIPHDMGFTSDWKHAEYDKHYPNGWDLEMVEAPATDHEGLMAAYRLNQAKKEKAAQ